MKQVAKVEASLESDPKPMDRVTWQRIRVAVAHEAIHRDWGCALYTLHRTGRINNDQREAGDKFARLAFDYKKLVHEPITDVLGVTGQFGGVSIYQRDRGGHGGSVLGPTRDMIAMAWADNLKDQTEFEVKRDERTVRRYRDAAAVAGPALSILEALVLDETWPVGERTQREISHALTRLSHFFSTGTKRKR
jgi:hypothetical protein